MNAVATTEAPALSAGSLRPLFAPAGVVVVGASTDPDKLGGAMAARLADCPVPVGLVNSRGGAGMHTSVEAAARAIVAADGWPDLAILCVPAAACPDVLRDCAAHGVRAALVCAGGFAETGPEGAALQVRLVETARECGVRLLGPNTSGFFVPHRGLLASFVPGVDSLAAGRVAVVAASGGLNHALAFAFQREDTGLSLGVGIGAGADVDAVAVLRYLAHDDETTAVALHLENVDDGQGLLAAIREVTAHKPVVALVVGQHDIGEFAQSHTGALATSWRTTRALLEQAGAVLVDRADDLVVAAGALSQVRLPPGTTGGVGLVTAQAGPGLIIADALPSGGVTVPTLSQDTQTRLAELLPPLTYQANPVDTGRPGPRHGEVIATVSADPDIDLVAAFGLLEPVVDLPMAALSATGPVIVGLDGPQEEVLDARRRGAAVGVTVTVGAQALACAVTAVVQDGRRLDRSPLAEAETQAGAQAGVHGADISAAVPAVGPGPWDEAEAKALLDTLGIRTPPRRLCPTRGDAHNALDELGGPVVVKVCDAAILHKSDVGGVHVGVADHQAMDTALDALARLGDQPALVEKMAPAGIDLVLGARRDPVFGPIVVCGVGGTATEVYADVAIASVPAPRAQLAGLLGRLRGRALVEGFRGQPVVDPGSVADVLARLGALLTAHGHLTDIEINPLRATSDGLIALDAVLVAGDTGK